MVYEFLIKLMDSDQEGQKTHKLSQYLNFYQANSFVNIKILTGLLYNKINKLLFLINSDFRIIKPPLSFWDIFLTPRDQFFR